ncbi:Aldo/keto reductase [Aspergillus steynii IBT 23096]|uniref:D-xylose reductase [NAD(P)H] n=1 Tax=Aspergillus steynii IBT 23096 TaxID=1392250 RepID=A0A2I2GB50_9EURO|nr:Aldo/keto reductase [Aspergillus steynii IBT 23096]PLB50109.1 Aldo/keto reductase [Aspergillus steynii IBT 23096]
MLHQIPSLGFGTFQVDLQADPQQAAKDVTLNALKTGYRHIDTAFAYGNGRVERGVGQAIQESGISRSEIFLVSKLHNTFHEPDAVGLGLERTLTNLQVAYVDLYLMHNPFAYSHNERYETLRKEDGSNKPVIDLEMSRRYPDTWKAMYELLATGKVKHIGVSNFNILKLQRLMGETGIVPTANQVEFNPYFPQKKLLSFCQAHGIQLVAHSPLGGAPAPAVVGRESNGPLQDPYVNTLAQKYKCTAAQVILSWILARGACAVPKSKNIDRMIENRNCHIPLEVLEVEQMSNLVGRNEEYAVRNLQPKDHIGFNIYDEELDQPV